MKTFVDDIDRSDESSQPLKTGDLSPSRLPGDAHWGSDRPANKSRLHSWIVPGLFLAMICAVLLLDAILPLRALWFHEALLTQLGSWPALPSLLLFPGWLIIPPLPHVHASGVPDILSSWRTLALLFGAFVMLFLSYLLALRHLPRLVTRRFVLWSTLVLGLLFALIPVVTSPDLYSYIAYARMGVIYGLNPLTTIPRQIHQDAISPYVLWIDQPSAYGPSWTLLTCLFQALLVLLHLGNAVLAMVLTLRLWGLTMHLCSVALVWSISGSLQRLHGILSHQQRLRATLAFAWNPLLLLEACTNAHNDTTLLCLLLLALAALVSLQLAPPEAPGPRWLAWLPPTRRRPLLFLAPAALLALGTCLKINLVLLMPGVFWYQWLQESPLPWPLRLRRVGSSLLLYVGLIVALYAPFWQGGAIFDVFQVNPATSRSINTLAETLAHLWNGLAADLGFALGAPIGSPAERFLHTLVLGLFVLLYAGLCWQMMRQQTRLRSLHGLVRWLAVTWLCYCAIGSPWFWPWYLVTFFGLYALYEASKPARVVLEEASGRPRSRTDSLSRAFYQLQTRLLQPAVVRWLALTMCTLYCFTTWGPLHSFIPGLPGFQWSYLEGVWAWLVPLLGLSTLKWRRTPPETEETGWGPTEPLLEEQKQVS